MRRLHLTFAGYWYIGLTIALGVVALMSRNNVLYLIESLLLSGMIFSGVLSERGVSAVDVDIRRHPACAQEPVGDRILVRNKKRFPLFCIEIGEWRDGRFVPMAFLPHLGPRAETLVRAELSFPSRGLHQWDGVAVATRYPFGLARKVRIFRSPGQRLVWPASGLEGEKKDRAGDQGASHRTGSEFAEGEVRPYTYEDDCRDIVWTLSEKGAGPLIRARKSRQSEPRVVMDLRVEPGDEFEQTVVRAAGPFHDRSEEDGSLTLIDEKGSRTFRGRTSSLNQLALVKAVGARGRKRA